MPEIRERVYQSPVVLPLDNRRTFVPPRSAAGTAHRATSKSTHLTVNVKPAESAPTFRPARASDTLEEIEKFCSRLSPRNWSTRPVAGTGFDQQTPPSSVLNERSRNLFSTHQSVRISHESQTSMPCSPSSPDSVNDSVDAVMKRLERLQLSLREFEDEARGRALVESEDGSSDPEFIDEANPLAYTPAHISSPRSLKISRSCTEYHDARLRENLFEVERIADGLRQAAMDRQAAMKKDLSDNNRLAGISRNSGCCPNEKHIDLRPPRPHYERWQPIMGPNFVNEDSTAESMPDAKEFAQLRRRFEGKIDEAQMMESIFQSIAVVKELCLAIKNNRARPPLRHDRTLQKQWTRYLHATGQIG